MTHTDIISALQKMQLFQAPLDATMVKTTQTKEGIELRFGFPVDHLKPEIIAQLESALGCPIKIQTHIRTHQTKIKTQGPIKNIIAIASGKGGVGKSTITYHLAQTLKTMGASVGILDADIYGPCQTLLSNRTQKPETNDKQLMEPYRTNGIEMMSIGNLTDTSTSLMWRGPMISQALLQLYQKTAWGNLDYLLLDLPPGTGDIPLTILQKIPVTAGVLVSLPHSLSIQQVNKSKHLFEQMSIPILGTIVNQEQLMCPHCTQSIPLYPNDEHNLAIIGRLPFDTSFQSNHPNDHECLSDIALTITQLIAKLSLSYEDLFGPIEISR